MSAAYMQAHCRLDVFMESNNMDPDQTAPGSSLIWVHIACYIGHVRTHADESANDISCDWQEKG